MEETARRAILCEYVTKTANARRYRIPSVFDILRTVTTPVLPLVTLAIRIFDRSIYEVLRLLDRLLVVGSSEIAFLAGGCPVAAF